MKPEQGQEGAHRGGGQPSPQGSNADRKLQSAGVATALPFQLRIAICSFCWKASVTVLYNPTT
jgi:hypothetical protein